MRRKKIIVAMVMAGILIFVIAAISVICLNGQFFSPIKYDKVQNCYIYNGSRYYTAASQNYYTYEKRDKIGRIWEKSFYTICNDEAENVIVVTGGRDAVFLVKENVEFGAGNDVTGVYFTNGTICKFSNDKKLLERLENWESLCTVEAGENAVQKEIQVKLCFNDIPVALNSTQYRIGYCGDDIWVLINEKSDSKMYQLTDTFLINQLRAFFL